MKIQLGIVVVAALVVASACGGSTTTTDSASPSASAEPSAPPELDAGAILACRKFAQLATDLRAGVVSDTELRSRMREVYDQAKVFPNSEATLASTALVRELNTGGPASDAAISRLVSVCGRVD